MCNRRCRDMMIAQILESWKDGVNETRIVYTANMSFTIASSYLATLTKNDLALQDLISELKARADGSATEPSISCPGYMPEFCLGPFLFRLGERPPEHRRSLGWVRCGRAGLRTLNERAMGSTYGK